MFRIKYSPGTKRITLFRNLLAQLCYADYGLSLEETLVLFDLMSGFPEQVSKDKQFAQKYSEWLITVHGALSALPVLSFPLVLTEDKRKKLAEELKPLLPSSHAFYGWKGNPALVHSFKVIPNIDLGLKKRLPPKRFLGVGYRDKGTAKDPAVDGSPSWKKVARVNAETDRVIQEQKENLINAMTPGTKEKAKAVAANVRRIFNGDEEHVRRTLENVGLSMYVGKV